MNDDEQRLFLGYPLDHLLDTKIELDPKKRRGGIRMPSNGKPGTGNMVICGPPGSGKSTLALQMAVACATMQGNHAVSAFITLESSPEEVIEKARPFGWNKVVCPFGCLAQARYAASEEGLVNILKCHLARTGEDEDSKCPCIKGGLCYLLPSATDSIPAQTEDLVLLPMLSPRTLAHDTDSLEVFWRRYHQLEMLLAAAERLEHQRFLDISPADIRSPDLLATEPPEESEDPYKQVYEQVCAHLNQESWNPPKANSDNKQQAKRQLAEILKDFIEKGEVDLRKPNEFPEQMSAETRRLLGQHPQGTDIARLKRLLLEEAYPDLIVRPKILPLVVIDSLNMFSPGIIEREELHQLFNLFRRYNRIGVFTVESSEMTRFDSTLADVVISLSSAKDNNYAVKHFEILKSRYSSNAPGLHPYKPLALVSKEDSPQVLSGGGQTPRMRMLIDHRSKTEEAIAHPSRHGIVVYPSLHYIVVKTGKEGETSSQGASPPERFKDRWKIQELECVLPSNLTSPSVVTVEGPRASYKTDLALSFLVQGLRCEETCLLIHLHDSALLEKDDTTREQWPMLYDKLLEGDAPFTWRSLIQISDEKGKEWQNLVDRQKATITVWQMRQAEDAPLLFEVDFKTGHLLSEEMVQVVRDIMIRREGEEKIKRVMLGDVGEIGAAYPFLQHSQTSGDLFLPAFAHIIRNHGADLIMTGSKGEMAAANDQVERACIVSDAVISTRFCDVFGQRQVILRGGGLVERPATGNLSDRIVPPVVRGRGIDERQSATKSFAIDDHYLDGLVGFDSGHVHRPGLSLHLFEENQLHARYNKEIETMLRAALACPPGKQPELIRRDESLADSATPASLNSASLPDVHVFPFGSSESPAMHEALGMLGRGAPLSRTVVSVVDEFSKRDLEVSGRMTDPRPYYKNVLLVAYRNDLTALKTELEPQEDLNWAKMLSWAKANWPEKPNDPDSPPVRRAFWADLSASETLACCLLDVFFSIFQSNYGDKEKAEKATIDYLTKQSEEGGRNELDPAFADSQEWMALHDLLHHAFPSNDELGGLQGNDIRRRFSLLQADAAIYVCWYSQLRELIDREPCLAPLLSVRALPGGGFGGDWWIGTIAGSVSATLGKNVLQNLCSAEEQYTRFVRGIGLPVKKEFFTGKFRAWPRATVTLRNIDQKILKNARKRSKIVQYPEFRSALYAIAMQLSPLSGHKHQDNTEVLETIERLTAQIGVLKHLTPE